MCKLIKSGTIWTVELWNVCFVLHVSVCVWLAGGIWLAVMNVMKQFTLDCVLCVVMKQCVYMYIHRITILGTGARWLAALEERHISPSKTRSWWWLIHWLYYIFVWSLFTLYTNWTLIMNTPCQPIINKWIYWCWK